MSTLFQPAIPPPALPNLHKYKYSAIDKSLLSKYILQKYWAYLITFFPYWMAPNAITLGGFALIVGQTGWLILSDYTLGESAGSGFYYAAIFSLFFYQSFDAIDGKQARRTNQSGPLGELFDHSCDALNTVLGSLISSSALHMSPGWFHYLTLVTVAGNFYFSTWEEYHTGTLYLGYISGPVEGIFIVLFCFLIAGYAGPEFFDQNASKLLPAKLLEYIPDVPLNIVTTTASCITMWFCVTIALHNVYRHGTHPWEASVSLLPFVILVSAATIWLYHCSEIFVGGSYLGFYLGFGFTFASLVARVIVAHVTHLPFPRPLPANFLSLPYVIVTACMATFPQQIQTLTKGYLTPEQLDVSRNSVVWCWAILAAAEYAWYAYRVTREVCNFLDIWCLTIKHHKVDENGNDLAKKKKSN